MVDKSLFKIICLCSLISGAILGVLPLIPHLTGLAFTLIMFFTAPFVIIYLFKLKLIKELDVPQCLSLGGISGFFSFLGFSIIYFPIAAILYLIFKINSFLWIKVIFTNIGFLFFTVILTALLCGLMNMFSAFMTVYLYEYFKGKKEG